MSLCNRIEQIIDRAPWTQTLIDSTRRDWREYGLAFCIDGEEINPTGICRGERCAIRIPKCNNGTAGDLHTHILETEVKFTGDDLSIPDANSSITFALEEKRDMVSCHLGVMGTEENRNRLTCHQTSYQKLMDMGPVNLDKFTRDLRAAAARAVEIANNLNFLVESDERGISPDDYQYQQAEDRVQELFPQYKADNERLKPQIRKVIDKCVEKEV